jgi:hypothetical protein
LDEPEHTRGQKAFILKDLVMIKKAVFFSYQRFFLFLLLFVIFTTGYAQRVSAPSSSVINNPPPITKRLAFDVYLDASISMAGYVSEGPYSLYAETLGFIEKTIRTGWTDASIAFYKFGERSPESIKRERFLEAKQPDFYDQKTTNIDQVVEFISNRPGKKEEKILFSIIITDLLQSDTDFDNIAQLLRDKFIKKSYAVGILGMRSEFSGFIYDLGDSIPKLNYKSNSKDFRTFRPFYYILISPQADIVHFYESLIRAGLDKRANFLLISPYILENIFTLENVRKSCATTFMNQSHRLLNLGVADLKRILQFEVIRKKDNATIDFEFDFQPKPWIIPFEYQNKYIEHHVNIFRFDKKKKSFLPLSFSEPYLYVDKFEFQSDKNPTSLKVRLKIISTKLPEQNTYAFEVVSRPKEDAFKMPPWVNDWSFSPKEMASRGSSGNGSLWGSRTPNLMEFLSDLWRSTYVIYQPKLMHLHFAVKIP